MTSTNIEINNFFDYIYPEDQSYRLCGGEISVDIEADKCILIPKKEVGNSHIVFQDYLLDETFKKEILNYPISNSELILYDYSSNVIGKYISTRENNKSGNLKNLLPTNKFLSEIKLPKIKNNSESIHLIINNYLAIDEVILEDSIKFMIVEDFKKFISVNNSINFKNVKLFIKKDVYDLFEKYIGNREYFDTIFKEIIVSNNVTKSSLEYLLGKELNFSDVSFQKHLIFENDVDIISVLSPYTSPKSYSIIGRGDKTLQLNIYQNKSSKQKQVLIKFVCLLNQDRSVDLSSELKLKYIASEHKNSDNNFDYEIIKTNKIFFKYTKNKLLSSYKENILFMNNINQALKNKKILNLIKDNAIDVIKYLFTKYDTNDFSMIENNYEERIGDFLNLINDLNLKTFKLIQDTLKQQISNEDLNFSNNVNFYGDYMNLTPNLGRNMTVYN